LSDGTSSIELGDDRERWGKLKEKRYILFDRMHFLCVFKDLLVDTYLRKDKIIN